MDKTITITAGAGLTGGGDLSSNKTINIASANDGITVNADDIQLNTVDNFTDTSTVKPLSAAKGKNLNDRLIPFENAFAFEGTGTEADPYKVRVNYSIYSVGDIIGSGSGAIYECSDTAIASYNSSATASKALAAGDVLIYDGTYWRNVANNTSVVNGLDAIITELRRLASATNNGLMSSSDFNKLNNVATYVSTLGAVTTSATNNTITVTTYNPATGTDTTTTLTFPTATTSLAGLLSATDKAKLDGIAAGANNYTHPNSGVTAGTYKSVTVNAAGHVTAGTNPTTLSGYGITDAAPSSHVGATGTEHGVATTSVNGFMSSTDKTKLDGVATGANNYVHPTTHSADILVDGTTNKVFTATEKTKLSGIAVGAEVNVNPDWNAVSGDAQILNKPTTITGYGITDAYTKTQVDTSLSGKEPTITAGTTTQYWRGDKSWQTLNKAAIGLSSVENTALSTWAGSTNISTVGTITNGTWSGSAIGISKGGTNLTALGTANQLLRVNASATALEYFTPAWPSVSFGEPTAQYSPLTINSVTRNLSVDGHTHSYLPLTGGALSGWLFINQYFKLNEQTNGFEIFQLDGNGDVGFNLNSYTRTFTINQQNTVTFAQDIKVGNNNLVYHSGNFTPSSYLPLSGGTLTGDLSFSQPVGIYLANGQYIRDNSAGGMLIHSNYAINLNSQTLTANGNTIWHSGNLNPSNYLPLSGGNLSGAFEVSAPIYTTEWFRSKTSGCGLYNEVEKAHWYASAGFWNATKNILVNGATVWHAGNDGAGSGLDADLLDGVQLSTIRQSNTYPLGNYQTSGATVANCKQWIVDRFNSTASNGIGANVTISSSYIDQWNNDAGVYYPTSVYSMIKIGGGYEDMTYGQFLLSSYNLTNIGVVGRTGNNWTSIKWLAFTDSNVASATYAENSSKLYSTDTTYKYGGQVPYYGYLTYNSGLNVWDFKVSPNTPQDVRVNMADRLSSTRRIWGQNFNGEGNVDGRAVVNYAASNGVSALQLNLTSPTNTYSYGLDIQNSNTTTGVYTVGFLFGINHSQNNQASGLFYYDGNNSINNRFSLGFYNNDNLFTIKADGNVGIGTTSPSYKLDVNGTGRFSNSLYIKDSANLAGSLVIKHSSASASEQEQGFVLYSSALDTKLQMGAIPSIGAYIQSMRQASDWTSRPLLLQPNGGNVGIGTTSPSYKLDINGTFRAVGAGYFNESLSISNDIANLKLMAVTNNNYNTQLINRWDWAKPFEITTAGTPILAVENFAQRVYINAGVVSGLRVNGSPILSASSDGVSVNGSTRINGYFRVSNDTISAGEYEDNGYGFINVCRTASIENASYFSMVRAGTGAFGIGLSTDNAIIIGGAAVDKIINNIHLKLHRDYVTTSKPLSSSSRISTGYDSWVPNSISCSNWFRSNGATGWYNDTYGAGINSDTANVVRTYSANKFKVYNTEADSITTLGGVCADYWFRSNGDSGWYNQTYGGGIYMTDSTYVKVYNYKSLWVNNNILATGEISSRGGFSTTVAPNATAYLGTIGSTWGNNGGYPTLYSSAAERWIMHINPHISYVQNGVGGYTGSMNGATIRFASNPSADSFWDMGVGTFGLGADIFAIGRSTSPYLKFFNNSQAYFYGEIVSPAGVRFGAPDSSNSNKYGLSFRSDWSATNPWAGVYFGSTVDSGTHGAVTGNAAIYFTVDDTTNRGWIFRQNFTGVEQNVASISNTGNLYCNGSGTFTGGGFNSLRNLKIIHDDWYGSSIEVINKFKIRDFNYKNQVDYNRTLGFIIDEVPVEVADYVLMGENRDSVNLYSLHALSFKAHQETKSEIDLLKEKIKELNNRIKMLENGLE